MGTLSGLFDLSRSALISDQAALSTVSNNVANQNTVGYVRQIATWSTGVSVTLNGVTQLASAPAVAATSQRDRVLEQRVQQGSQQVAETSARSTILSQIEDVFSITGSSANAGSTAIGTALDSFFSSLSALAASPSDTSVRGAALSAASTLASAFNQASTQLAQVGSSLSKAIPTTVASVNALTATIAQLNGAITANSPTTDAGALENERQSAIAQLSQLVGLDQITTEHNGITLTTRGGAVLVAGNTASTLTTVQTGALTTINDATGQDVTATIAGGTLGGQLTGQHSDLAGVQGQLNALALRIGTAVNATNAAGVDTTGAPGGAIFAAPPTGTAGNFQVVAAGPGALAAAAPGEGTSGNTNANALADLVNQTDASGLTAGGALGALLAGVGTSAASLSETNTAQTASLTQLTTERNQLSGVSLDEEAANLTQFQRTYEAATKLFSIIDTLLAAALNLGEPTTVS